MLPSHFPPGQLIKQWPTVIPAADRGFTSSPKPSMSVTLDRRWGPGCLPDLMALKFRIFCYLCWNICPTPFLSQVLCTTISNRSKPCRSGPTLLLSCTLLSYHQDAVLHGGSTHLLYQDDFIHKNRDFVFLLSEKSHGWQFQGQFSYQRPWSFPSLYIPYSALYIGHVSSQYLKMASTAPNTMSHREVQKWEKKGRKLLYLFLSSFSEKVIFSQSYPIISPKATELVI